MVVLVVPMLAELSLLNWLSSQVTGVHIEASSHAVLVPSVAVGHASPESFLCCCFVALFRCCAVVL